MYEFVEEKIGQVFAAYGRFAARHAVKIIIVVIIINVGLGIGLLNLKAETDVDEAYYPKGSQAEKDQDKVQAIFPDLSATNFQAFQSATLGVWARVIVKSNSGNLLSRPTLERISALNDMIQSIQATDDSGSTILYTNICAKSQGACVVDGSVFWSSDFLSAVDSMSVTYPTFTYSNGYVVDYTQFIGGNIQTNGTHLQGVEYIKMEYWFRTDISSEAAKKWCDRFLDVLEVYTANDISIAYAHYESLDEELAKNVAGDIALFSVTMTLMITYSCIATLSARIHDQVGQRMWLGYGGLAAAALAILAAFGFCSAIGVEFVSIVGVVPFLIVGIGIDDMFILLSGLSGAQGKDVSVEDKIAKTMKLSGVGITITSLTDFIAFMAGAGSSFLSVRNFCIYTGVAVVFCYFNNLTLFCACMAINERRVGQGRHYASCMKVKTKEELESEGTKSKRYIFCCSGRAPTSREEAESFLDKVPRWLLPKIVLKTPIKIIICVLFLGYLGASIYGCVNLKQGLELSELVNEDSYYYKYSTWNQDYFPRQTPVSFVIDSTYTYSDPSVQSAVSSLISNAQSNQYIHDTFSVNWLDAYMTSPHYDNSNEPAFIAGLQTFLAQVQYSRYENDVVIDSTSTHITASRVYVISGDLEGSQEEGKLMIESRDIADDSSLNCFAFHPSFLAYEQYVAILGQTLQSVGIALAAVFVVTCIFMPHPLLILYCTVAVTMIMVGVFGFMYYIDVALSAITMIHLIMSIGFSVDFTAHICHGYMTSNDQSRAMRVRMAIDKTGAPIFHGAISSILGVVILFAAKSYIFRTFATVMMFVLVFGICHSVLLLPVVLSWIGPGRSQNGTSTPSSCCNGKTKPEKEEKVSVGLSQYSVNANADAENGTVKTDKHLNGELQKELNKNDASQTNVQLKNSDNFERLGDKYVLEKQ